VPYSSKKDIKAMKTDVPDFLKTPTNTGYKYGTLRFDKGRFVLSGESVMLAFAKRVFPGAMVRRTEGELRFGKSFREFSDLNWLMMRFPLDIQCEEQLELSRAGAISKWKSRETGEDLRPTKPPSDFTGKLFPYQEEAVTFMVNNRRTLLGDSMGLGKTWSALGAAAQAGKYPVLVVCQPHVQLQWQRAIGSLFEIECDYKKSPTDTIIDIAAKKGKKLAPILKGQKPYELPGAPFMIIHYGLLSWWSKRLLEKRFPVVIFDEIQELRHEGTKKYSAASLLSSDADFAWGLSVGGGSIVELRGGIFGLGWVGRVEDAIKKIYCFMDEHYGVFDVSGLGIEARGFDGKRFRWSGVNRFYKHRCTSDTRKIFVGGCDLVLTDDHSVFRAESDGKISCVRSDELKEGDVVPYDDGFEWDGISEEPVDVIKLMRGNSRLQVAVDLSGVTRGQIGANPQEWYKYTRSAVIGHRLPVDVFEKNRSMLPIPEAVYLAPSKSPRLCDPSVMLSDAAYVLGFFIGDGWISDGRVCFAVERPLVEAIVHELGKLCFIRINPCIKDMPRGSVEVRVNSVILASIFHAAFNGIKRAYEKEIPGEWIISWPRAARMELLRGMIDSDGHISKRDGRIYYTTTSSLLAGQLLSLLRSIGVRGNLNIRSVSDGGVIDGKVIHGRRPSYVVNWSGHAMRGDSSGYKGCRRSMGWTEGKFLEGKVRRSDPVHRPEFVYDLEMSDHPSFVANGSLVHNSGTPVYGYGAEIWSVMNALDYHCLGGRDAFTREWCEGYGGQIVEDPKALNGYLVREGLLLRRKNEDVDIQLPRIVRMVQDMEADDNLYNELVANAKRKAEIWNTLSFTERGKASREIEGETRQAAGIAKASSVAEFVAGLIEGGERPIVCAWHHAVHDILQECLRRYHIPMVTGRQSQKVKDDACKEFVRGDSDAIILSLRSASGLDGLQARATCTVFAELDWSPSVHSQIETRISRLGVSEQVIEVPSYYCVARCGFDEIMLDVLGVKTGQFTGIMGDAPEDYEEQVEAEKRAASRIKMLVEKLKNS
jgi:hypothetical protein